MTDALVLPFAALSSADVAHVGGKNASLGELRRSLTAAGVRVPDGFATTAAAYRLFLAHNGLETTVTDRLADLADGRATLAETGASLRAALLRGVLPDAVADAVWEAYAALSEAYGEAQTDVAVRSSATAEDLPEASFAGQQETYLGVRGEAAVLDAVRACFASLWTDRAISYREAHGFDHAAVALSAGVQKMVRADLGDGAAGVLFTLDTETGFPGVVLINAAWGLGENVVKGVVNPDEVEVFKPLLGMTGPDGRALAPVVSKKLGTKALTMRYAHPDDDAPASTDALTEAAGPLHARHLSAAEDLAAGRWADDGGPPAVTWPPEPVARSASPTVPTGATVTVPTPPDKRDRFVLSDVEAVQLATWGAAIEAHYGRPMDVEWARDGATGDLFILQARPETVEARRGGGQLRTYRLLNPPAPLVEGVAVGRAVAAGPVRPVYGPADLAGVQPGDVVVARMTEPDWVPALRWAAALVTDAGGRTCHAAIVARELGIPAVVGTGDATGTLLAGDTVTVSCADGAGRVYPGHVQVEIEDVDLVALPVTRTKVMLNLASPDGAYAWWRLPADGVGLARMEFVVGEHLRVHPMALAHPERVPEVDRARIAALAAGYATPTDYFVEGLARGLAKIAASRYPAPVVVRLSDFKTNEYARLLGGAPFEPDEENPMLGWRGASRYDDDGYRDGFALECRAIRMARDEIGLSNIAVMVPFCRTPAEADRVLRVMDDHGLRRGEKGLEVLVMAEVPSNIVEADAFAERFDGFSVGTNDLTQLLLGVDRDSERLAPLFDERSPTVQWAVRHLVERAHAHGRPVGVCGQAPSDHPDVAAFLVEAGVDSLSVTPDAFAAVRHTVALAEEGATEAAAVVGTRAPALAPVIGAPLDGGTADRDMDDVLAHTLAAADRQRSTPPR